MLRIESKLSGDLSDELDNYCAKINETVIFSGVASMAKVLYDEAVINVSGSDPGQVTGNLKSSIYRVYSSRLSNNEKKTYRISWNRKKAPHGHLVEFGTSRAPAHPFLRPAFDKIDAAIDAGKVSMSAKLDEITGVL